MDPDALTDVAVLQQLASGRRRTAPPSGAYGQRADELFSALQYLLVEFPRERRWSERLEPLEPLLRYLVDRPTAKPVDLVRDALDCFVASAEQVERRAWMDALYGRSKFSVRLAKLSKVIRPNATPPSAKNVNGPKYAAVYCLVDLVVGACDLRVQELEGDASNPPSALTEPDMLAGVPPDVALDAAGMDTVSTLSHLATIRSIIQEFIAERERFGIPSDPRLIATTSLLRSTDDLRIIMNRLGQLACATTDGAWAHRSEIDRVIVDTMQSYASRILIQHGVREPVAMNVESVADAYRQVPTGGSLYDSIFEISAKELYGLAFDLFERPLVTDSVREDWCQVAINHIEWMIDIDIPMRKTTRSRFSPVSAAETAQGPATLPWYLGQSGRVFALTTGGA